MTTKRVVVLIPTYNERENVQILLPRISNSLAIDGCQAHILIIDDNSPDGTGEIVESMRKKVPNLYLIRRSGKMGLGSAYIDGFRWALENLVADVYIQMDADLSHPPEILPELVQHAISDADIVVASRYVNGGRIVGWPWYRKLISRFANNTARLILNVQVEDLTTAYRALSSKAVNSLLDIKISSPGYSYLMESIVLLVKMGFCVLEIPSIFTQRTKGKTKLSVKEFFDFIKTVIKVWLRLKLSGINAVTKQG